MTAKTEGRQLKTTGLRSYIPILTWLPAYDRRWLRSDLIAGLTLAALVVPEGMAYAELAGMPPETALYGAWIALVLFAVFATSRHLVVGAASAVAVMSAAIVSGMAPVGSSEFLALTAALAILTGIISVLAGMLKLGSIAQFFSESVLIGFVSGLSLLIIAKQLPKLLGLETVHGNFWELANDVIGGFLEIDALTALVGLSSLAVMIVLERRFHRLPAALVALLYGIVVVTIFDLQDKGVHIVGEVPAGLAPPTLPMVGWEQVLALLPGALGLSLLIFAEALGPIQSLAGKHGYEVEPNRELTGLGMANVGAGLFQSFSVGGSLSKTASSDGAGAVTQVTGLVAAAVTMLVAFFLTPLFHNLPEATLAAIVVVAVSGMFKVRPMQRLLRVRRTDFILALTTFLAVLTLDEILYALLFAVLLSLVLVVYRISQPRLSVLERMPGRVQFVDARRWMLTTNIPGLLIIRPDEGVFFANAAAIRQKIRGRVFASEEPLHALLLDMEMSNDLDAPSAEMLIGLNSDLKTNNVRLMLCRIHGPVEDVLDQSGGTEEIGRENMFPTLVDAVVTYLKENGERPDVIIAVMSDILHNMIDLVESSLDQADGDDLAKLEILMRQLRESENSLKSLR